MCGGGRGTRRLRGGSLPAAYERKPSGRGRRRRADAPHPAGRRYRPQRSLSAAPAQTSRAVLHAPGSLSPGKITIKGAPAARPRRAAQTLDTDLSRQDIGTYQEDGGRIAVLSYYSAG
jgi:hypothetical protein